MATRNKVRLTDAGIARLRPEQRERTVWDSRVAGLGVRVRPSGGKSYVLIRTVGGRTKRISLGPVASKGIEEIRQECLAMKVVPAVAGPKEPERKAPLFRDFVAGAWHEAHFMRCKPSTRRSVRYYMSSQLLPAFGATRLDRITGTQVERWFDGYSQSAPGGANRVIELLCQILNFGIACGHLERNPARGVERNRRPAITRFLSRDEIRRLHQALNAASRRGPMQTRQADMIRLLIMTGCRKGEIVNLRWSEVDGDTLSLADSKTGPRKVHLNPQARAILDRQPRGAGAYVFPSPVSPDRPSSDKVNLWQRVRREASAKSCVLDGESYNT